MLLTNRVRDGVFAGDFDLAFRRWQKLTVKSGGRLRTALGEIDIIAVTVVDPADISDGDATRAGYQCADDVRNDLFRERTSTARTARTAQSRTAKPTADSVVYRIEMVAGGADPRVALRLAGEITADELESVIAKLARMDAPKQVTGRRNWTRATLELIEQWPARRAPELAEIVGLETMVFKASVRRLKELGLTESLAVGYRLSPRGTTVLRALQENLSGSSPG
jgi:hypothetical protein